MKESFGNIESVESFDPETSTAFSNFHPLNDLQNLSADIGYYVKNPHTIIPTAKNVINNINPKAIIPATKNFLQTISSGAPVNQTNHPSMMNTTEQFGAPKAVNELGVDTYEFVSEYNPLPWVGDLAKQSYDGIKNIDYSDLVPNDLGNKLLRQGMQNTNLNSAFDVIGEHQNEISRTINNTMSNISPDITTTVATSHMGKIDSDTIIFLVLLLIIFIILKYITKK
jgi:hypothetical protein